MNPMEEWSYDSEYIGESAQNAVEYHILEDHMYPPHMIKPIFTLDGIGLRCTYCNKTLLEWDRPEKED